MCPQGNFSPLRSDLPGLVAVRIGTVTNTGREGQTCKQPPNWLAE